jgi:co-chaperonin GroES (HSP10)
MKHLFNKIRPIGNRTIVITNTNQKKEHSFTKEDGTEGNLYIANEYSWDGRVTNFTQGTLLNDFKNLKAGTNVLLHHNSMGDECELAVDGVPDKHKVFAVDAHFIYFGIDGEKIMPIDGYLLVERLYEPEDVSKGGIILTTEKVQIKNKVKILATSESCTEYKVGQVIIMYPHSDYMMTHNVNGKIETIIRVKYSDCLAIDHDFDKRGY